MVILKVCLLRLALTLGKSDKVSGQDYIRQNGVENKTKEE